MAERKQSALSIQHSANQELTAKDAKDTEERFTAEYAESAEDGKLQG